MLPSSVKILYALGGLGLVLGWALFFRMAIEVNRRLPPQKKFFLQDLNMHFHEVKRLHEETFPVSALRTTWFVLMVASVMAMVAATILAVRPR